MPQKKYLFFRSLLKFVQFFYFILFFFSCSSQAQILGFSNWQQQLNLSFTTTAQTLLNKNCSSVVTVRANRGLNIAYTQPTNLVVNLSGPSNLTFYSDSSCVIPITSVTILSGSSSANFYFLDTVNAAPAITATTANYRSASQTETLTANGFVWTGAVSSVWSTNGNWSGGVAPGVSNVAVFDGTCSTNCSPTFTGAASVRGLRMDAGYTGTISQSNYDMTLGAGGFSQLSGTFIGSTNPTYFLYVNNGPAAVAGGTFTAPAGIMRLSNSWLVVNSPTMTIPSGSTLHMQCSSAGWGCAVASIAFQPGTAAYAKLILEGRSTTFNLNSNTMTITEDFTFGDQIFNGGGVLGGTINVAGNITQNLEGYGGSTLSLVATGNPAGQIITGIAAKKFLNTVINSGVHPITLSGTLRMRKYNLISSGAFTSTSSTLELMCSDLFPDCEGLTVNIDPGTVVYNNVVMTGYSTTYDLSGATFNVAGNFSFGDQASNARTILNGTISVTGNITAVFNGLISTSSASKIVAAGNPSGQTITGLAGENFLNLEINTGAHPVTLAGELNLRAYNYISSGAFTTTGSTLNIICGNNAYCDTATIPISLGAVTYNHLLIRGYGTTYDLGGATTTISGNFSFGDSFSAGRTIDNGTLNVAGNITAVNNGHTGTLKIVATGNMAGQTITGISGRNFLPLEINTGANPVTLSGTIRTRKYTYISSGTMTTTGSTLFIYCTTGFADCASTSTSIALGTVTYDHLTFGGFSTTYELGGGTVTVAGNFTFGDTNATGNFINNSTINIGGNITLNAQGYEGSALLVATGNAIGQIITGVNNKRFLPLQISAGANPITLVSDIRTRSYNVTSMGTLTATGSLLEIRCAVGLPCDNTTVALSPGSGTYNNVTFFGYRTAWDSGGGTWNIGGNLTIGDQVSNVTGQMNNATLSVAGNTTVNGLGITGNASLHFVGSAPQTLTGFGVGPTGSVVVNQTGSGSLTLLSATVFNSTGQDFTILAGHVNMGGFALTVNDVLTIGVGTSLTRSGGALTYGSLVNNGTLNP